MVDVRPQASNWPQTSNDQESLIGYALTLYQQLENPKANADGNIGCVSGKPLNIFMELGNEVNIGPTFCTQQDDAVHKDCAARYIQEQAYFYPRIKNMAASFGTDVTVVGCSLASHHTPFLFNLAVKAAIKAYHLKGPYWDICDYHPYAQLGSQDPLSGINQYPQLVSSISDTYGKSGPILYGETAVETNNTPTDMGYFDPAPYGALVFPEDQQASVEASLIGMAKSQANVIGFGNFHLIDECSLKSGFQSGMYYCNLTPSDTNPAVPKSSQPAFLQATLSAYKP